MNITQIIEAYQKDNKNSTLQVIYLPIDHKTWDEWEEYYSRSWSEDTPVAVHIPPVPRLYIELFKEAAKVFPRAELEGFSNNSVSVSTSEHPNLLYLYAGPGVVCAELNYEILQVQGRAATLREAAEVLRVELMVKRNGIDQALKLLEDIPC